MMVCQLQSCHKGFFFIMSYLCIGIEHKPTVKICLDKYTHKKLKYAVHSYRLAHIRTHTNSHTVSHFLTNVSSRELTLLQPLCSHPIKGSQIDFDNNFQLRLCINYCYKWHTYIFHPGDVITLCVDMSECVCLCVNTRACIAFQSVLCFLIIFCLFHFLPMDKKSNNDKDDKMQYTHTQHTDAHLYAQTKTFIPLTSPLTQKYYSSHKELGYNSLLNTFGHICA